MATSNFNFSVVFSLSIAFFLVLLSKVANSTTTGTVSFTFNNFSRVQPNLILQRDAVVTSYGVLRLTKVDCNGVPTEGSLGRALYAAPVHIWDSATGTAASWATSFAFNISAPDITNTSDGIAFFLAPVGSQPQSNGAYLGVFNEYPTQAVAVEFDTHCSNSAWDPLDTHIGIDVNRIRSVETVPWGVANGQVAKVLVTYDAFTSLLVASLVYPSQRNKNYIISAEVDLKNALPEWVSVGLSATTGTSEGNWETREVLSWSFASKFSDGSDAFDLPSFMLNQAF